MTTTRTHLLLASLWILACSGRSEPPRVTPEPPPPPSTTAPPTSVAPPETVAPPEEIDAGVPPTPLSSSTDASAVRDRFVATLPVEEVFLPGGQTVHVVHPNAVARARLDVLIAEFLSAFADETAREAGDAARYQSENTCVAVTATRALVSIECSASWTADFQREETTFNHVETQTLFVDGATVTEIEVTDALIPGANIEADRSIALADATNAIPDGDARIDASWSRVAEALGPHGILELYGSDWGYQLEATIPYERVVDRLRADGPVARMLGLGAFAPDTSAAATPTGDGGPWTIGAAMHDTDAAARWAALPARLRGAVGVYASGDDVVLGVDSSVGIDVAREVASALHGSLGPAPTGTRTRFELRSANGSVNVRAQATSSGRWLATLPRGAVAIVQTDGSGATDPWLWVLAAPSVQGMSSARYLDAESCFPDASAMIASVPEDARTQAAASVERIRATAVDAGHVVAAVLFLAHDTTRSFVSLRRLSTASCTTGAELGSWTIDGVVVDALVTRTSSRDPETLVLVQTQGADAPWLALRRGTPTPVWRREGLAPPWDGNPIVAPATHGPSGRGYWPLAIVQRGQPIVPFRWDGSTLVQDTP